jgi:hypothetical protein
MTNRPDLIIPVYLNQRLVFDLVAMLQGGIATVTRISQAERETERSSGEVTGGFGLSQALSSLLKINLSGKVAAQGEAGTERTSSADRVHTPASLLFMLRNLLTEQGLIRPHSSGHPVGPGEFIEFTGVAPTESTDRGFGLCPRDPRSRAFVSGSPETASSARSRARRRISE